MGRSSSFPIIVTELLIFTDFSVYPNTDVTPNRYDFLIEPLHEIKKFDMKALQALDRTFDPKAVDMGLERNEGLVSPAGAQALPGSRMYYDLQSALLNELERARRPFSRERRVASALRLSGAQAPEKDECVPTEVARRNVDGAVARGSVGGKR